MQMKNLGIIISGDEMKKFIKPNEIKRVSKLMTEELEILIKQIEILLNDINKIKSLYKGYDADIIVSKYIEKVKNLKYVVANYENCINYFNLISGTYNENINTATKNLNQIFENLNNNKLIPSNFKEEENLWQI